MAKKRPQPAKKKAAPRRRYVPRRIPLDDLAIYPPDQLIKSMAKLDFDQFDVNWVPMVIDTMAFEKDCGVKELCKMLSAVRELYRVELNNDSDIKGLATTVIAAVQELQHAGG